MAIKTSELNARLFGKVDKRRATTAQEAQKAASEKVPVIQLSVAGEESVEFELVRVPACDVSTRTSVFTENAREQSFLNELALSDILVTLKERGQQYPAVGRWLDDDRIEVLDGSRRRMACIHAGQDFLIYVAHRINSKHAKFLSDVANAHKPLSLYERGREMQALLDRHEVSDQKELAKVCQCSEALVSGALKAASLPLVLLQAYPSVSELGRPTIVKLHRLYFSMTDDEKKAFLEKLHTEIAWKTIDAAGVNHITREVTLLIETWANQLKPSTALVEPSQRELIQGRATYRRKGDNLTLNLKKITDEDMNALFAFLAKRLS